MVNGGVWTGSKTKNKWQMWGYGYGYYTCLQLYVMGMWQMYCERFFAMLLDSHTD
jgi:hypothetical protein